MVPKFLAHRCWCSHTPLKNNSHGLHQSQGLPASLPWSNAHDLLLFSCMLIDCCAFFPHLLLSSAIFADLLEFLTDSTFLPWSFCTPPPVQDGKQKQFLHPTEPGKEQSSQHRPISKLSVLKSPKYPAFNLYCRQHSAAVERASPDLPDTPTPTITVNGQCTTFLSCGWNSPILFVLLVPAPGTAKQGSAYIAKKPLAKPKEMLWRPVKILLERWRGKKSTREKKA